MNHRTALDSDIATYFIKANLLEYNPREEDDDLAKERVATVRIYLYSTGTFGLMPTTIKQIKKITNLNWLEEHTQTISTIFEDFPFEFSEPEIEMRKNYYFRIHSGGKGTEDDCRILAEAEIGNERYGNYNIFLTNDRTFIQKLKDKTYKIKIMRPSELWDELKIPKGSQPEKWFSSTNPNYNKDWWKW